MPVDSLCAALYGQLSMTTNSVAVTKTDYY